MCYDRIRMLLSYEIYYFQQQKKSIDDQVI